MAKKNNTGMYIVGALVAAVVLYEVMKPKAAAPVIPPPPVGVKQVDWTTAISAGLTAGLDIYSAIENARTTTTANISGGYI